MSLRDSAPWTGHPLQPDARQLFLAMLWASFARYSGEWDTSGPENPLRTPCQRTNLTEPLLARYSIWFRGPSY